MGRDIRVAGLFFLLAAGLFVTAFFVGGEVERQDPDRTIAMVEERAAMPAEFRLINALLGSFRSLLVDFLWIRADALQQEGRYFAASEAARWITMLQSRVTSGWSYQAWNLAFNVTSVLPPEERWPYVSAAMTLLWRDGLRANPGNLDLHYEIARLWQSKVASIVDIASPIYREKVLAQARRILGRGPIRLKDYMEAEGLMPLLREEPVVQAWLSDLAGFGVTDADAEWVDLWENPSAVFGDAAQDMLDRLASDDLLLAFDRGLRARAWQDRFGLTMADMQRGWDRYGDLGLGSAESFVVCWTTRGLFLTGQGQLRQTVLSLWRMRLRGLLQLFRKGVSGLAEKMDRDYAEMIALVADDPVHSGQANVIQKSRLTMLVEVVPKLYLRGRLQGAERLYKTLAGLSPEETTGLTLSDYAFKALVTDLSPEKASLIEVGNLVKTILVRSMWRWTQGDQAGARDYLLFARDMHARTQEVYDDADVPAFGLLMREARTLFLEFQDGRRRQAQAAGRPRHGGAGRRT